MIGLARHRQERELGATQSTPAPRRGTMEEVPNAGAYTQHIARPLRYSVDFEVLSSERTDDYVYRRFA
jgi:hypothetical protein